MRRMFAAMAFLVFGFAAGYLVDSIGAVRAQTVTVTGISILDANFAAVVIGGRVYTCPGVRSNSWTCKPVQVRVDE